MGDRVWTAGPGGLTDADFPLARSSTIDKIERGFVGSSSVVSFGFLVAFVAFLGPPFRLGGIVVEKLIVCSEKREVESGMNGQVVVESGACSRFK